MTAAAAGTLRFVILFSLRVAYGNAAAHNNCLLNSLRTPYSAPTAKNITSKQVYSYVSKIPALKKSKSKETKLSNPVIHDFIALLFLFDKVCTSIETKKHTYETLHDLFHQKFTRNKSFLKLMKY